MRLNWWPKNRRNVELNKKVRCSPSAPPQTSALTEPMLTPELTLYTPPWVSSHAKPSEPLVAYGRDQISYVYPSRQALSTFYHLWSRHPLITCDR